MNELTENLSNKLCAHSADTCKVPSKFVVGSFCLALHSEKKLWYRAQVLSVNSESILAEFIDYGMEKTVAKVDIRLLNQEFSTLPRCCVDIVLHDVHLSDVDPEKTVEWLQESLLERTLNVDIVSYEGNMPIADVFMHGNTTSVNDQIYELFSREALSEYVEDNSSEIIDDSSLIDVKDFAQTSIATSSSMDETIDPTPLSPSSIVDEYCSIFPPAEISPKEEILCTFVRSATKLSFQLLKYESVLNNITELLAEEPKEMFQSSDLEKGSGVIARSVQDDNWYRAVVIDASDENITVLFIDYGNTEDVPLSNLRKITDERFLEPATCITCKLHNVRNVNEINAKEWLEQNCVDQIFDAQFIDGKNNTKQVVINFAEKEDKTSINQQIQAQFQMQIDSAVLNRIALNGSSDVAKEKRKKKINYVRGTDVQTVVDEYGFSHIVLQKGTLEKATCSMVESVSILYFQLVRLKSKLERFMSMLENEAEDFPTFRFVEEGTPCVAPYQDMSWHRGKVLSVNTGCTLVQFVDFGYMDDVITEDIRVIKRPEMLSENVYSIKCRLAGVSIPDVNEEEVLQYLRKMICDNTTEVYLDVVDFNRKEMLTDVILMQDEENINEFLQNNYGPCLKLNMGLLKLGDKINVTIPSTKSLSSFWCKLSDSAADFVEMMDNLQTTYSAEDIMTPEYIEVGDACCVRSAQSGLWHRAQIQEEAKDEHVSVLIVDDGTIESIALYDVRVLLPQFYILKVQGFEATLFDVRPTKHAENWSEDALTCFNDICKQDILTATIMKCNDHVRLVTLVTSDGVAVYELLTSQEHVNNSIVK